MTVLAGDIGGTNARLAIVEMNGLRASIVQQKTYPSRSYPGLAPIVRAFCETAGTRPECACIAIACPVIDGECTAPNLPWKVSAATLAAEIEIPRTTIINDFVAVGYAVELLGQSDLATLQEGDPTPEGPIALIGAGTGLGQGFLLWDNGHYWILPSEGGHADFAPRGKRQGALLEFLEQQFGRVSWERLLSGPGLLNAYRYLAASGAGPEQPAVRAEMDVEPPAVVIARHALDKTDSLSDQALDLFCEVLGAQAGNLALTVVATGGVYLSGGLAPRFVDRLRSGAFLGAFRDKGRMSTLLSRIPIHVIVNPNVGLLGAAAFAASMDLRKELV